LPRNGGYEDGAFCVFRTHGRTLAWFLHTGLGVDGRADLENNNWKKRSQIVFQSYMMRRICANVMEVSLRIDFLMLAREA